MLNKNVLKTVGSVAKGAFEIFSTVVVAGLLVTKVSGHKRDVSYLDAVNAVMNSSLWSDNKVKIMNALKPNFKPEVYEAVVGIVNSSMWFDDKTETIIRMCKQAEES